MYYFTLIQEIQDEKGREGIKPSLLVVLYYFSLTINSFSKCATLPSRKFRRREGTAFLAWVTRRKFFLKEN